MALDVTAVLQELHCVKESEGGSEPYIWPVLLWIDDTTIHNTGDDLLGVRGPALGEARVVLKQSMKPSESAPIPWPLSSPGVRLEAASGISFVILVVALWDYDETPQAAMWEGCKAFESELRTAIVQRIFALKAAVDQGDDEELQRLIGEIKLQVRAATRSAISDGLTGWEKTRYLFGSLNLDDYVGAAFYFGKPEQARLDLLLKSDSGGDEYRIAGSIEAQPVRVDLCQAQAETAAAARRVVEGIEGQIAAAKAGYQNASPAAKSIIRAELEQLYQDLDVAMAAYDEAGRALQRCRDRWAELADIRSSAGGAGVVGL